MKFDPRQWSFALPFRRMRKGKTPPMDEEARELAMLKRQMRELRRRIYLIEERRRRRNHRLHLESLLKNN